MTLNCKLTTEDSSEAATPTARHRRSSRPATRRSAAVHPRSPRCDSGRPRSASPARDRPQTESSSHVSWDGEVPSPDVHRLVVAPLSACSAVPDHGRSSAVVWCQSTRSHSPHKPFPTPSAPIMSCTFCRIGPNCRAQRHKGGGGAPRDAPLHLLLPSGVACLRHRNCRGKPTRSCWSTWRRSSACVGKLRHVGSQS